MRLYTVTRTADASLRVSVSFADTGRKAESLPQIVHPVLLNGRITNAILYIQSTLVYGCTLKKNGIINTTWGVLFFRSLCPIPYRRYIHIHPPPHTIPFWTGFPSQRKTKYFVPMKNKVINTQDPTRHGYSRILPLHAMRDFSGDCCLSTNALIKQLKWTAARSWAFPCLRSLYGTRFQAFITVQIILIIISPPPLPFN